MMTNKGKIKGALIRMTDFELTICSFSAKGVGIGSRRTEIIGQIAITRRVFRQSIRSIRCSPMKGKQLSS